MKRISIIIFFIVVTNGSAQIPKCTITMKQKEYETLFKRDIFSEEYLPATFTFRDTVWKDVKIRFKGRSKRYFSKKSFRIKFQKKHSFHDAQHINLHAMYNDKSFLVEKLAYDLFKDMGMLAPEGQYVNLDINQDMMGLYLLVDRIDENYLRRRGRTPSSLYNTDGIYALSDLTEQPDELLKIYYPKEVGDTNDYSDLKNLIHAINAIPDSSFESVVNNLFDMSSVYNWLAGNIVMMMGDSYSKNYFLYHDISKTTNKWVVIPWDYDIAFGMSGDPAVAYPMSLLNDGFTYTFPPLSGPDNVLKNRLWENKNMREQLRRYVDTLLQTVFTEEHLYPHIDSLSKIIENEVKHDSHKRGSYQDFVDDVEAVKNFITWRRNYLLKTFVNVSSGTFNIVTLPIQKLKFPYRFIEADGRTIATMWFTNIQGLDSITILAHADVLPPSLKISDTVRSVKRWLEVLPFPTDAAFSAKLEWQYRDVSSTDREVGTDVKDERILQLFSYNGKTINRLNAKLNPICNSVVIDSIDEQQCGYGKYLYLALP